MLGISSFGMLHTLIGLAAVAAGIIALWRFGRIGLASTPGKAYVWLTVVTCVTGLFIFRHGGFGPPHALAVLTLIVLPIAAWADHRADRSGVVGVAGAVLYSLTLFFHYIPAVNETLTRVPVGAPLAKGPEDPIIQGLVGGAFLIFLVGVAWQVMAIRRRRTPGAVPRAAT